MDPVTISKIYTFKEDIREECVYIVRRLKYLILQKTKYETKNSLFNSMHYSIFFH